MQEVHVGWDVDKGIGSGAVDIVEVDGADIIVQGRGLSV